MDKLFYLTLYNGCDYLSMLGESALMGFQLYERQKWAKLNWPGAVSILRCRLPCYQYGNSHYKDAAVLSFQWESYTRNDRLYVETGALVGVNYIYIHKHIYSWWYQTWTLPFPMPYTNVTLNLPNTFIHISRNWSVMSWCCQVTPNHHYLCQCWWTINEISCIHYRIMFTWILKISVPKL